MPIKQVAHAPLAFQPALGYIVNFDAFVGGTGNTKSVTHLGRFRDGAFAVKRGLADATGATHESSNKRPFPAKR